MAIPADRNFRQREVEQNGRYSTTVYVYRHIGCGTFSVVIPAIYVVIGMVTERFEGKLRSHTRKTFSGHYRGHLCVGHCV